MFLNVEIVHLLYRAWVRACVLGWHFSSRMRDKTSLSLCRAIQRSIHNINDVCFSNQPPQLGGINTDPPDQQGKREKQHEPNMSRKTDRGRERDVEQMRLGRIINETLILIPEQIHWLEQIGTIRQEMAVDIISCVEGTDGLYPGDKKVRGKKTLEQTFIAEMKTA